MDDLKNSLETFENTPAFLRKSIWIPLICLLVFGFVFLLYPFEQKREIPLLIEHKNDPLLLNAPSAGFLKFQVEDLEKIQKGDTLLSLESSISLDSLHACKRCLSEIVFQAQVLKELSSCSKLGLSTQVATIKRNQRALKLLQKDRSYQVKRDLVYSNIESNESIYLEKVEQKALVQEEIQLVMDRLSVNKMLFEEGSISAQELDQWQQLLLQLKQKEKQLSIDQKEVQQSSKMVEKELELESLISSSKRTDYKASILFEAENLLAQINTKLKNRFLLAPTDGQLVYEESIINGTRVNKSQTIGRLYDKPREEKQFFVRIPASWILDIESDTKVLCQITHYPKRKYGLLIGTLGKKYPLDTNNLYKFQIDVPSPYISTKKKILTLDAPMYGKATLILGKKSYLSRLWETQ